MGTKITGLTEDATPALTDLLTTVEDPSGSPLNRKLTINTLLALAYLSGITSGYHASQDLLMLVDNGVPKSTTLPNLFAGIEDFLSQLAAAPDGADTFLVIDAGTAKYITLEDLAPRQAVLEPFSFVDQTDCATGNGKAYFPITEDLDGRSLVGVAAVVHTAGTTGTMSIQIRNHTDTVDMLSTLLTIDSGETSSFTAATAAVIKSDGSEIVAKGEVLAVDVDGIHTTAAKGLMVILVFA